jgi:hypothetical protein
MGSVKTTSAELEELFTTEELETFFEELEELFDLPELDELLDFAELEDSSTVAELDDGASFSLEDETLALLEELFSFSTELEEVSGSTPFTPEESPPQATKKNNEKTGNKLQIFIS